MEIRLAKTAGFCFGVNRAVELTYNLLDEGHKVATLGPLIHNPQAVADMERRGALVVDTVDDIPTGYEVIIRSHGVPRSIYDTLEQRGLVYHDATCPFVKKIHQLAAESGEQGKVFLLAGDKDHPEVKGILGHCKGENFTVKNNQELVELLKNHPELRTKPLAFAAQTTFHAGEWEKCLETLKKLCTNAAVFATICNATARRQKEAKTLAQRCDRMIVVGGRDSSNTAKLRDICAQYCETYLIERADELPVFSAGLSVGITAGASTPASIIKEVLVTMTDKIETNELNFEEM